MSRFSRHTFQIVHSQLLHVCPSDAYPVTSANNFAVVHFNMGLICIKLCRDYFLDENGIFACDSKDSATHLSLIDLLMVVPTNK